MSDWTDGYVADIGYTYGYYSELNPLRLKLAFLSSGLHFPQIGTACELGFGQGLSVNIHAAASVTEWCGTDFNPSQAGFAQELADASGSNAKLYDQAFADFFARDDLPDFDYIGLHGIWSWISDENRQSIIDFVHKKLKVGGVLYVSYNTLPGWSTFAPVRHLLTEHADTFGVKGKGIGSRLDGALEFVDQLIQTDPIFRRANPTTQARLAQIQPLSREYLAHEYLNRHWYPMYFSDVAKLLDAAKLQYACSANYLDHIDPINLTEAHQALLEGIPDAQFRQTVRDFIVNQQFRRDYWVKGARQLNPFEQKNALRQLKLVLITPRQDVTLKVTGSMGEADMSAQVYNPILDLLAEHKPKTIAEMEKALAQQGIAWSQLMQALVILAGTHHIGLVQDEVDIAASKPKTEKLNAHLCSKARFGEEMGCLASPVTGGGIAVARFHQLFLLAMQQGNKTPTEWAAFVLQVLEDQGRKLLKEGQTLNTAEENLAELTRQAKLFEEKNLPALKALQIA